MFYDVHKDHKKWYNGECVHKRNIYQDSIARYICNRTPDNFQDKIHNKKQYKACVKRSKMRHMHVKAQ